jgi:trk system potassium uptake protein
MQVIIAGCGRVGAHLATALDADGHAVAIIDKDPRAFRRLPEGFTGRAVRGIVFDADTLEEAGVKAAQAFVAVTSGDNSNIVSARVAKERFGVERVVARIYDPERAYIFERLGIVTVASALWTSEEIQRALLPTGERIDTGIGVGDGDVVLLTLRIPKGVHGSDARVFARPGESVVAAITRQGRTTVPAAGTLLEEGDEVHLAVLRSFLDQARTLRDELAEER